MMQTTNFLTQIAGAGAGAPPARSNAAASQDGGASFSQTFSQATQRQAAAPPPAPAPAAAAAPKQASQAPKQNAHADKPPARAAGEAAKPAQAAGPATTEKTDSAKAADSERDAAAAAEAAASAPVVDMLALVASLQQAAAAVPAAQAPVPADAAAAETDPALTALGGQLLPGEDAALEQDADAQAGQGQQRQGARAEFQAEQRAGAQAAPQVADGADALSAADAAPRFKLPEIQAPLQPQAAPGAAAVQQTSMAQAVANAAGDQLQARVGSDEWDNQVGQKIVWMVAGKEQSASLTLNPPDLGPMQVVLNVTNDHADVTFSAAQPEVRQALEDALPRLREMMSESGLSLGNASVNDGMPEQRQAQMGNEGNGRKGADGRDGAAQGDGALSDSGSAAALEERAAARSARTGTIRSLVDTYI